MHAALAEVPVERGLPVAELVVELLQVAQVVAEVVDGDGGVLPARPGVRQAGHPRGGARARTRGPATSASPAPGRRRTRRRRRRCSCRSTASIASAARVGLLLACRRPSARAGRPAPSGSLVSASGLRCFSCWKVMSLRVEPLEGDRLGPEDRRHRVGGGGDVGVAEEHRGARLHPRHEPQLRPQHHHTGALGADQRLRDVKALLGQQAVEVVARHPARDVRVGGAQGGEVLVAQRAQLRVDLRPAAAGALDLPRSRRRRSPRPTSGCRRRAAPPGATTLSTTLPVRCAVAPQELLPIIPPSVQWSCVAGSGPNSSW